MFVANFKIANAQLLDDSQLCCALIALEEQARLFPPNHAPESYESTGLVVALPEKLLELDRKRWQLLRPQMSVREIFQALGVGLLQIDAKTIEWFFEDGSTITIKIGPSIDTTPVWVHLGVSAGFGQH